MLISPFIPLAPPNPAPRAAYGLDSFDVLERHVDVVPEDTRERRRVDCSAVDQHQNLVRIPGIEPADADGPGVGINLLHVDTRSHTQQVRNVGSAGSSDILL